MSPATPPRIGLTTRPERSRAEGFAQPHFPVGTDNRHRLVEMRRGAEQIGKNRGAENQDLGNESDGRTGDECRALAFAPKRARHGTPQDRKMYRHRNHREKAMPRSYEPPRAPTTSLPMKNNTRRTIAKRMNSILSFTTHLRMRQILHLSRRRCLVLIRRGNGRSLTEARIGRLVENERFAVQHSAALAIGFRLPASKPSAPCARIARS